MIHSTTRLSRGARLRRGGPSWTAGVLVLVVLAGVGCGAWALAAGWGRGRMLTASILAQIFKR
jgi:hypothetical protein